MCASAVVAMVESRSFAEAVGNASVHTIARAAVYGRYCEEKKYGVPDTVIAPLAESLQGVKIRGFANPKTGQVMPYTGNAFPCGDWNPEFDSTDDVAALQRANSLIKMAEGVFGLAAAFGLLSLYSSRKES